MQRPWDRSKSAIFEDLCEGRGAGLYIIREGERRLRCGWGSRQATARISGSILHVKGSHLRGFRERSDTSLSS